MSLISIPKSLREKLGEEGSEAFVNVLNQFGEENKESAIDITEKRFETMLAKESSLLREDMVRGDESLRVEIQACRADIIKWMCIFWVGQIGVIIGILFAFFK